MAAMEKSIFRTAEPDAIISTLLHQGPCCSAISSTPRCRRRSRRHAEAYEATEKKHVPPDLLRQLGLPMYSDVLFTPRHYDLIGKVFGGRDYWIDGNTLSRRWRGSVSRRIG